MSYAIVETGIQKIGMLFAVLPFGFWGRTVQWNWQVVENVG